MANRALFSSTKGGLKNIFRTLSIDRATPRLVTPLFSPQSHYRLHLVSGGVGGGGEGGGAYKHRAHAVTCIYVLLFGHSFAVRPLEDGAQYDRSSLLAFGWWLFGWVRSMFYMTAGGGLKTLTPSSGSRARRVGGGGEKQQKRNARLDRQAPINH